MRQFLHGWNRTSANTPYKSISSTNQEIRLAVLAPGDYDDAIVIELHIKKLSRDISTEYDALSYAWGQEMCPNRAVLNGKLISIGENLDCALRHLRHRNRKRKLWVDALCIDQINTLERNSQVQLMDRIYSTAHRVIIWLGPANDDDVKVVHYMRGEVKMRLWNAYWHRALINICKRSWFSRVWVVSTLCMHRMCMRH